MLETGSTNYIYIYIFIGDNGLGSILMLRTSSNESTVGLH